MTSAGGRTPAPVLTVPHKREFRRKFTTTAVFFALPARDLREPVRSYCINHHLINFIYGRPRDKLPRPPSGQQKHFLPPVVRLLINKNRPRRTDEKNNGSVVVGVGDDEGRAV
ncbi:hypothetical protein GWI33_022230 [Rhynchophorus ferrugineus]|uniref:Uncharacterized protein n=1 Tax=Rhynchophorus ferrugineus TaxID=354439 RepID=A0A834LYD0_RHYFE|nr:hypothetical protein GWI33_022234 [Rhynchophorus ferrugineus]KAF7264825.1 hypothetical protein GWI33_022230 [Rhynchophorus ferrugineus]